MIAGALAALLVGAPLLSQGTHVVLFTAAALAFVTAVVLLMGTDNRDPQGRIANLPATVWTNARLVVRDPTMRLVMYKSALVHIGFTSFLLSYQLFATQELGLLRRAASVWCWPVRSRRWRWGPGSPGCSAAGGAWRRCPWRAC